MWDVNEVEVWVTRSFEHVLVIQGWFLSSRSVFSIENVYTPSDGERNQELWSRLGELINNNRGQYGV